MRVPKTLPELNEALANIMAGAINGDIKESEARIALNAATRINENLQVETRMRALAFAMKAQLPSEIPLGQKIWEKQLAAPVIEQVGQENRIAQ